MLDRLRDQPEPLSLAALVRATGQHENTLREHLDGLLRVGLVRRERAPSSGRGRPAWLYEAVGDRSASEYAGLAAALALAVSESSADPAEVGRRAGVAWGRQLAQGRGAAAAPPEDARARVVELLDDLGFAPEQEAGRPADVHLTRCPLLEAAHRHPEVVCAVHLGLVEGALAEHGASAEGSRLEPFARPGSCLLTVPPVPGDASH